MGDELEDDFMVEQVSDKVQGDEEITIDDSEKGSKSKNPQKSARKKRYLAFVGTCVPFSLLMSSQFSSLGNLPYDIKVKEVEKHFEKKCGPKKLVSVRILTNKDTGKSKGFAFVEFSDNESYHKGLDCHQSLLKNRRINVEMTAGGGGSSSEARKGKIKKKNEWLAKMRIEQERMKTGSNSITVAKNKLPNPTK